MKYGCSLVVDLTISSSSCHSLRFCMSMALYQSMVTARPREPVKTRRTAELVSSTSPRESSRSCSAYACFLTTNSRCKSDSEEHHDGAEVDHLALTRFLQEG